MGDEVTKRTKSAIAQALSGRLDQSLEAQKARDDFLDGVLTAKTPRRATRTLAS